jgi:putative ABC transport system substrate-binding protein
MMDRRTFLAGTGAVVLAAPLAAEAQPAGKVYRVGVIASTTSIAELAQHSGVGAFVQRLRELGWNEGRNIVIERRTSEGKTERFAPLTAEFVALGVDVIVLVSEAGAMAARGVTGTTPIVMVTGARPVEAGLAASLARPGGNVTGHTLFAEPTEEGKRLQLLKEAVPRASRIVYLGPEWAWATDYGQEARNAARVLGITLTFLPAREQAQFLAAFEMIRRQPPDALYAFGSTENFAFRQLILDFATRERLPALYAYRETVEKGGLMSYGASLIALWQGAARHVDKILRGTKPGDLPIERPMRFELVINLKTAKALGLTIPPALLLRADQLIK